MYTGISVNCMGKNLTSLPDVPEHTVVLNISNNNVSIHDLLQFSHIMFGELLYMAQRPGHLENCSASNSRASKYVAGK